MHVKRVCSGRELSSTGPWVGAKMIGKMEAMLRELRMTVVTPAPVASSAAMILVSIPPVPNDVPSVVVLTGDTDKNCDQRVRLKTQLVKGRA